MPPRFGLGAAEFDLVVNNDQLLRGFAQSEVAARANSKKIADAIDAEMRRSESSLARFGQAARGAFAFGSAVTGATVGLAAVHQALSGVVEVTQRAQQAQFALRATYQQSAGTFSQFAREQSQALKLSETGFQQAAVSAGTLAKNYGFTADQIKLLIARSTDLAAVQGLTVEDAVQRVVAAMRGEAEAAERLGLTLNSDAVKGLANLTAAQLKNFETMDQVTKGQILFTEFLRQSEYAQGQAAKRSVEGASAFDRLGAAQEELGKSLGENLNPTLQAGAALLADLAGFATQGISAINALDRQAGDTPGLTRLAALLDPFLRGALLGQAVGAAIENGAAGTLPTPRIPTPSLETIGPVLGPSTAQIRGALKDQVQARIDALKEAADARTKDLDRQIKEGEKDKERVLKLIEERQEAEIKAINATHQARLDANRADIEGLERAKDAAIDAAQDRHDATVRLLEAEAQDLRRARELEDRQREDARTAQDRQRDAERTAQDRAFDAERDAAIESLRDQEEARKRTVASEIRAIEERTQTALRGLDAEAEAARDASDAALRALDAEQQAEGERHRERMDNLAAEEAREIGRIDRRLEALDRAERQAAEAERNAELRGTLTAAQRRLSGIRLTGNPAAIAAAERAVAAAQAALDKEEAQRDREATRRRLQNQQEEIRKRFDAEKKALDDQDRERKAAADAEKQRIRDVLDAALEAIAGRRQRVQDDSKDEIQTIRDNDQAAQDRHNAVVARTNAEYDLRQQRREDDRRAEDQAIADARLAEDRFLADSRAAMDEDIRLRREAADEALKAERDAIEEHYNGPEGVLTKARKATEEINREHQRILDDARDKHEQERQSAQKALDDYLDGLRKQKELIKEQLDQQVKDWEKWKDGTVEQIGKVLERVNELIRRLQQLPGSGVGSVSVSAPGGGGSGGEVSGDVDSWLREALALTGTSEDWLPGLHRLVQGESSGDPRARNPEPVIDRNGNNLGHATGLLQTIPSTFDAYKLEGHGDIWNPVDNAVAAIRYIKARYGSVYDERVVNSAKYGGYAEGGWINEPIWGVGASGRRYTFGEREREFVVPLSRMREAEPTLRGYGRVVADPGLSYTRRGFQAFSDSAFSSAGRGPDAPINVNVYQRAGEDSYTFARRVVAVLDEQREESRRRA